MADRGRQEAPPAPREPKPDPDTLTTPASTALAPREDKTPARLGVVPTSVEEGWRLAVMMAKSELVPKGFRNQPADVMVAVQLGAELGLAPMQALQSIGVINGRPGLWGDGMLGVIMASPLYQDHDECYDVGGIRREIRDGLTLDELKIDTTAAIATFWRRRKADPTTRRFSIGQARKARLLTKEGPWQDYPDRMLHMRARSWAARDTFPDVLRGLRMAEELYDLPADDRQEAPRRRVRRASELAAAAVPEAVGETSRDTLGPTSIVAVDVPTGAVAVGTGDTLFATPAAAAELAPLAGSDTRIRYVVTRDAAGTARLESFEVVA
jgi:hypothetical protein